MQSSSNPVLPCTVLPEVRTLVPLEDVSLASLRICYLDPFKSLQERRGYLSSGYYFHCDCQRCRQEEAGREEGEEQTLARELGEAFMQRQLKPREEEKAVREVVRVLGEGDMLSLRATKLLFNHFLERGEVGRAVEWGEQCWACYSHHTALNPSAYVQTLLKLAQALSSLGTDYVQVLQV